jgi:hypothetical protein
MLPELVDGAMTREPSPRAVIYGVDSREIAKLLGKA